MAKVRKPKHAVSLSPNTQKALWIEGLTTTKVKPSFPALVKTVQKYKGLPEILVFRPAEKTDMTSRVLRIKMCRLQESKTKSFLAKRSDKT